MDEHLSNQETIYNNNGITSSIGCNDMTELIRQFSFKIVEKNKINKRNKLVSLGYSETFALMLLELYPNKYEKAVVFAEEGLSKDMRTYLLFKDNKQDKGYEEFYWDGYNWTPHSTPSISTNCYTSKNYKIDFKNNGQLKCGYDLDSSSGVPNSGFTI